MKQRFSDITPDTSRPKSADIDKHRSESFPRPNSSIHAATAPSPEHSGPGFPYTGAIAKKSDLTSSMSSQDSGINMSFTEHDDKTRSAFGKDRNRTISAHLEKDSARHQAPQRRVQSESAAPPSLAAPETPEPTTRLPTTPEVVDVFTPKSALIRQSNVLKSTPSQELDPDAGPEGARWLNLPKDIWKQAAEALDDFGMIKDGDRILVCLSGSSSSLCLLHLLRQFIRARHLSNIQLATVTFGDCGVDPRALMLYLRELGIEYFYEQCDSSPDNLQERLTQVAHRRGYNVLAMANSLDKLADRFLGSLLYKGKLNSLQAISTTSTATGSRQIRIIRPLLYIRERSLEDFAAARALPTRPSHLFTRPPDATNSILRTQEVTNPNVYGNIRSALKPLMALRLESTKSTYETLRASLDTRD